MVMLQGTRKDQGCSLIFPAVLHLSVLPLCPQQAVMPAETADLYRQVSLHLLATGKDEH